MESAEKSYRQILKSSAIMGGAASINLISGMLRTKFAAVLIGTSGVGLLTSLTSMSGLIGSITGLGLQSSVVREVAIASDSENSVYEISIIIKIINRICFITGLSALAFMYIFGSLISKFTFDDDGYANEIAFLGFVILLTNFSGSYMAVLQGLRRVSDIAKINIFTGILGSIIAICFYILFGLNGIIPGLISLSSIQFYLTWKFIRKFSSSRIRLGLVDTFKKAGGVARLGLVFMWNNLLGSITAYIIIIIISRKVGLEAVGIYSAAFSLSGVFVNFILGAMGTDYYPRLTGVSHDRSLIRKLVNEQTEIGLLLAVPGLLISMALAPWFIKIFYTNDFLPAVGLLQWFLLGCLGRVISWPMGYIVIAINNHNLLLIIAGISEVAHVFLVYFLVEALGVSGVAIAFPILLLFTTLLNMFFAWRTVEFSWNTNLKLLIIASILLMISSMLLFVFLSSFSSLIAGLSISILAVLFSAIRLFKIIGHNSDAMKKFGKIFRWL